MNSVAQRALKTFFLAFLVLAYSAGAARAYTDYSFSAIARVDAKGNAHVVEKTIFNLDNEFERSEFEYYMGLGKTTLSDWRKFSKHIKYHFTGAITNLKIIATREFEVRYTAASVSIEYNVAGLFNASKKTSRITEYKLVPEKLAFGSDGRGGEISLGNNMQLSIELPKDATNLKVVPEPGVTVSKNSLVWVGPVLGKWDVSFEIEKPLSEEVSEFFMQLFEQLSAASALVVLIIAFITLLAVKVLKGRK